MAAASAFTCNFIPRRVWGANDRFYVAGIGVGGKGAGEVKDITAAGGTFVALCDVDATRAKATFRSLPEAKIYSDFREMLEKEKGIDAVSVSTPDHTHAVASLAAMSLGKHVYCQKPLTHTIQEARWMRMAAERYQVKTQMGNQAHAGEPIRRAVELVRAGIIGPVREVHCWTNRPIWPQGQQALRERQSMTSNSKPSDLNWDLWLGPAKMRDFNECYVPFKWRGWWDFGTGALGDMACHIMDMPYWALRLGAPRTIESESAGGTDETGPDWSTITYHFDQRAEPEFPAVKFVWYDGIRENRVNAPYELLARATEESKKKGQSVIEAPETKKKMGGVTSIDAPDRWDLCLVGDRGTMLFQRGRLDWLVSPGDRAREFENTPQTLPRVENEDVEWVLSCRGGPPALSHFDYSGPFTEMVLLGNLAVRLQKKIEWDAVGMKVTNAPEAEPLLKGSYRPGWNVSVF
jgi:predicted dehydrogenase